MEIHNGYLKIQTINFKFITVHKIDPLKRFKWKKESQRQKKIASVLQRDLVEVLQNAATQGGMKGILISVSKVKVTVDLIYG